MKKIKVLYTIIFILSLTTCFLLGFIIAKNTQKTYNQYPTEYTECYSVTIVQSPSSIVKYSTSKEYSEYNYRETCKEIWIKYDKDNYYLKIVYWDNSKEEFCTDRHVHGILVNYK